jgi:hypothetical protein
MMYQAPSNWFDPPLKIGRPIELSEGDKAFVAKLYPRTH